MGRVTCGQTSPHQGVLWGSDGSPRHPKGPSAEDRLQLGAGFTWLAGSAAFRKVVGSIDVWVKPSAQHAACYLHIKFFYSVQFQAVCDHKISGHFCGLSRSAHNTRMLKHSPIYLQQKYPLPGFCILGDGGYPCLKQCPHHPPWTASRKPAI